jgi:hypothetical protein
MNAFRRLVALSTVVASLAAGCALVPSTPEGIWYLRDEVSRSRFRQNYGRAGSNDQGYDYLYTVETDGTYEELHYSLQLDGSRKADDPIQGEWWQEGNRVWLKRKVDAEVPIPWMFIDGGKRMIMTFPYHQVTMTRKRPPKPPSANGLLAPVHPRPN